MIVYRQSINFKNKTNMKQIFFSLLVACSTVTMAVAKSECSINTVDGVSVSVEQINKTAISKPQAKFDQSVEDIKNHSRKLRGLYKSINETMSLAKENGLDAKNQMMVDNLFQEIHQHNKEIDLSTQKILELLETYQGQRDQYEILFKTVINLCSAENQYMTEIENINGSLTKKGQKCQSQLDRIAKKYQYKMEDFHESKLASAE